jgi:hypothetical protein
MTRMGVLTLLGPLPQQAEGSSVRLWNPELAWAIL